MIRLWWVSLGVIPTLKHSFLFLHPLLLFSPLLPPRPAPPPYTHTHRGRFTLWVFIVKRLLTSLGLRHLSWCSIPFVQPKKRFPSSGHSLCIHFSDESFSPWPFAYQLVSLVKCHYIWLSLSTIELNHCGTNRSTIPAYSVLNWGSHTMVLKTFTDLRLPKSRFQVPFAGFWLEAPPARLLQTPSSSLLLRSSEIRPLG